MEMLMAYSIEENGRITKKKNGQIAESFMGVSGETGPMSKKDFKKFKQFILDTTIDGSAVQKERLDILKKQRKFGV
jgi:hypothetical protein